MNDLHSLIQLMIAKYIKNSDLTDLEVGTVETAPPDLSIKLLDSSLPPIKKQALLLTRNVVEQFVTIYEHNHMPQAHNHGVTVDETAVIIDDNTHNHTSPEHKHQIDNSNTGGSEGGTESADETEYETVTIDDETHNHTSPPHTHTADTDNWGGNEGDESSGEYVPMDFTIHGKKLKVRPGVHGGAPEIMWIQEELKVGDKVLLMSVQGGQRYVIVSRVFEMY
ncbi:MAG: DUF2577 domain-containing protein [Oscillospiraceae bacterium]|jgi:hypothetical protein|nr:DUF2577 domain-containing protein [Oscillospiraceae bacterium]